MAWTHTRAKIAHAIRANPGADVTDLRRQLKAERLEDHIKRIVEAAPPLTQAQRERLALVIRGSDRATD